jgi:hypothetical protein
VIADIAHGDLAAADVSFLVGLVLAVVAGLFATVRRLSTTSYHIGIGWLAVAAIALGLLLL